MADLPINLLIIGPEYSSRQIASIVRRTDVQVHEAVELVEAVAAQAKPPASSEPAVSVADRIDAMVKDGRPWCSVISTACPTTPR